MILAPDINTQRQSAFYAEADSAYVQSASEVVATKKPEKGMRIGYKLDRELLSLEGGQLLVRLRRPLTVEVDPSTMNCGVFDWGVTLPVSQVAELPNRLARQFLSLFSKADRGVLSDQESDQWLKVVDQVDYRRFCIDRAAPQYLEGQIQTKQPTFVIVRWYDDTPEKIEFPVASALSVLQKGDEFGAYVKLGLDNKAISIERLTILSAA